ncbi:hypothetical protein VZT92_011470 [Zoarces viviparus]|uniref:Uncharacterized protein n=1 Tax=Zoarces viviparus TaxID=48416 RepID=A0AAW1F5A4_ZOAVI
MMGMLVEQTSIRLPADSQYCSTIPPPSLQLHMSCCPLLLSLRGDLSILLLLTYTLATVKDIATSGLMGYSWFPEDAYECSGDPRTLFL